MVEEFSLDGPAKALAARRVAVAFARGLVVVGASKTIGWLLPPMSLTPALEAAALAVAGVGLLVSLLGRYGHVAYAGALLLLVVVGGGTTLFAAASLLPSALPQPPASMSSEYQAVLSVFYDQYNSPPWMVARSVAALTSGVIGVELCRAAWLLVRVPVSRRPLLAEPPGRRTGWFLDIPPGVFEYSWRDPGTAILLGIAALLLLWVQTSVASALVLQHDRMLEAVAACVGTDQIKAMARRS